MAGKNVFEVHQIVYSLLISIYKMQLSAYIIYSNETCLHSKHMCTSIGSDIPFIDQTEALDNDTIIIISQQKQQSQSLIVKRGDGNGIEGTNFMCIYSYLVHMAFDCYRTMTHWHTGTKPFFIRRYYQYVYIVFEQRHKVVLVGPNDSCDVVSPINKASSLTKCSIGIGTERACDYPIGVDFYARRR